MGSETAHGEDAPAATERAPRLTDELPPVFFMALLFIASIGLAMTVAPTYVAEDVRAFDDPDDVRNPLIYLVIVVAFTALILLIAKWGKKRIIQGIILSAVFLTINYVTWPLLRLVIPDNAGVTVHLGLIPGWPDVFFPFTILASLTLAVTLVILLAKYPEWWVIDTTGVLVSAGAAAIFGISFGLLPALILLVAFAVYDFIAVYRTKHMLDLADNILELRLPIMFVIPRKRGYSFLEETRRLKAEKEETGESGQERDAMFMGLGDAVIPAVLVVSALTFLPGDVTGFLGLSGPLTVALAALLGGLVGYAALMYLVLKGNPQAGLPLLNGGTILGFFIALIPLYGIAPVWPF
jgi:presenilin-like A22 family membrane protease